MLFKGNFKGNILKEILFGTMFFPSPGTVGLYCFHAYLHVTFILRTCYAHATHMICSCYTHVTIMLHTGYAHVTHMLNTGYAHHVTHMLHRLHTSCYTHVTLLLHTCYAEVTAWLSWLSHAVTSPQTCQLMSYRRRTPRGTSVLCVILKITLKKIKK